MAHLPLDVAAAVVEVVDEIDGLVVGSDDEW